MHRLFRKVVALHRIVDSRFYYQNVTSVVFDRALNIVGSVKRPVGVFLRNMFVPDTVLTMRVRFFIFGLHQGVSLSLILK